MKSYPTIEHTVSHDIPVVVFDKLDGSNIRAEWNRKQKKFYKFGSRNVLLDETSSTNELSAAIPLIREKYEQEEEDEKNRKSGSNALLRIDETAELLLSSLKRNRQLGLQLTAHQKQLLEKIGKFLEFDVQDVERKSKAKMDYQELKEE